MSLIDTPLHDQAATYAAERTTLAGGRVELQRAFMAGAEAAAPRWIPVAERMPASGAVVFAAYKNQLGKWRRIRAQWIAAKSVEASCESEIGEYDEATDTYYDPEGWYERIDNWDDYSAVVVYQGTISHWMPLPGTPDDFDGDDSEGGGADVGREEEAHG